MNAQGVKEGRDGVSLRPCRLPKSKYVGPISLCVESDVDRDWLPLNPRERRCQLAVLKLLLCSSSPPPAVSGAVRIGMA